MLERKAVSRLMFAAFLFSALSLASFAEAYRVHSNGLVYGSNEPGFDVNRVAAKQWSFDDARAWRDFAYADEDSAELVIGLSVEQLNAKDELSRILSAYGGKIVNTVSVNEGVLAIVAHIPFDSIRAFAHSAQIISLCKYVEPNFRFETQSVPNDSFWGSQWGPRKVEADWAWNTTTGSPSIIVAVVDTGIDWNHPDLSANYVALGHDWVNNDANPMDDEGHGTHVAGIIAAVSNNGVGIAGLAQIKIMAEKGLDSYGYGYEDDLADGIIHATNQGADIISMSWGSYFQSSLIYDAIKYAHDAGVLLVGAAGNEATTKRLYPAAYDEVIAVTASDTNDNIASFSNFGNWVELAAPGVNILSTYWDNSYAYASGTSMATPHVSGVAALLWSQFPSMTSDEVRFHLRWASDDLGSPGFDIYYGFGRVNARKAVELTPPSHDLSVVRLESPPYLEPGETAILNSTIFNYGTSSESDVIVQFLANGSLVDSIPASVDSLSSINVSVSWSRSIVGTYNITAYVLPVPDETKFDNNALSSSVSVLIPPKILIVADNDELGWQTSQLEFESALNDIGCKFLVWTEFPMGRPSLKFLLKFELVIWTTGDYYFEAVDSVDAVTLQAYLNQGGNIMLEGQDVGFYHESDTFMVNVAHSIYQVDYTDAPGLTVTDSTHPVTQGLPSSFLWLADPLYDDGGTPTNGGFEVIRYTGTSWTAVTVFDGTGTSQGSVVYYAFPIYCLAPSERNTLIINSVNWLHPLQHDIAVVDVTPYKTIVGQVYPTSINVTVENQGDFAENFDVTLCADSEQPFHEISQVGYWKFDEGSGTIADDSSGNGNTGTLVNGPAWVDGRRGMALSFDGVDDYVEVSDSLTLDITSQITISGWVRLEDGYAVLAEKWNVYGVRIGVSTLDGYVSVGGNPTAGELVTPFTFSKGVWYYVAYTFDGSQAKAYVDGNFIASKSCPGNIDTSNLPLWIGANGGGSVTKGTIDDVRIYNRTLSADEIKALYLDVSFVVQTQTVTNFQPNASVNLTVVWNPTSFAYGNYAISAYAWPVQGETDTADNTLTNGIVTVVIPGDVNADGIVNILDAAGISAHWYPGPPIGPLGYDPNFDINNDGVINVLDAGIASAYWTGPPKGPAA